MVKKINIKVKGLSIIQCDQYNQAKVKKRVNKAKKYQGNKRVKCITMNIHNIKKVYNKSIALLLFTDKYSGLIWDYYLLNKITESLMKCIKYLLKRINR